MKTSNKILIAALALTLLHLGINVVLNLRGYAKTKSEGQTLLAQLSEQPIRTLITTGEVNVDFYSFRENRQVIGIYNRPQGGLDNVRISGDTLYLSTPTFCHCNLTLPHLESYLKNGEPTEIHVR